MACTRARHNLQIITLVILRSLDILLKLRKKCPCSKISPVGYYRNFYILQKEKKKKKNDSLTGQVEKLHKALKIQIRVAMLFLSEYQMITFYNRNVYIVP